jgi:hypothetical protein
MKPAKTLCVLLGALAIATKNVTLRCLQRLEQGLKLGLAELDVQRRQVLV